MTAPMPYDRAMTNNNPTPAPFRDASVTAARVAAIAPGTDLRDVFAPVTPAVTDPAPTHHATCRTCGGNVYGVPVAWDTDAYVSTRGRAIVAPDHTDPRCRTYVGAVMTDGVPRPITPAVTAVASAPVCGMTYGPAIVTGADGALSTCTRAAGHAAGLVHAACVDDRDAAVSGTREWHVSMSVDPATVTDAGPVVHLHGPVSGPVCGAPRPVDPAAHMTAYRSDTTCPACIATLR